MHGTQVVIAADMGMREGSERRVRGDGVGVCDVGVGIAVVEVVAGVDDVGIAAVAVVAVDGVDIDDIVVVAVAVVVVLNAVDIK